MKAIMFAAGKSTRTYPLTITRPKPLLPILDTTIIEYNLALLEKYVSEVIIVVGYKKDMLISHLKESEISKKIKLTLIEQKEQLGTGHALLTCEEHITDNDDSFLVMGGDDIFSNSDIMAMIDNSPSILAQKVENPDQYGVIEEKNNKFLKIHEKQKDPISNLVNCGMYVLNKDIFKKLKNVKKSPRGEIELTDALSNLNIVKVKDLWYPISYPWNLLEANVILLNKLNDSDFMIKGKVEDNVTIKGKVFLGEGSVIKAGSYIEGPVYIGKNCTLGPMAHIRKDTIICDNCEIGKTEIYDALIMKNSTSKHTAYLAHGIIGENVNIGAGTITADYRHDGKNHMTIINNKKIDSKRRKLGAFLGDNVHTGIGTLLYPGRKIWPGLGTLPGEVVTKDKKE
ncbi:MAG: bifunctional sugar-1-phosphate nucleotidylyltransferase/acetyltransferase [Nanoarchaeota archaeon]